MSTGPALQFTSTASIAHNLSTSPTAIMSYSPQAGPPRMLMTANLPNLVGRFPHGGLSTTSFSSLDHNRRTNSAGRRKEDGRVEKSWKRIIFRSRSTRRCYPSRYERQRRSSSSVQCAEERQEILPTQEDDDRNNRVAEGPSLGNERISSRKALGAMASGKRLEVRMLQRLDHTLADRGLLAPGQRVLLAVSGGQDSVCLMHLLVKLQRRWEWKIGIAHCDHQWSSSAREQAAHVAQMARGLGLDYYQALTVEAVPGEGVARTWRYGVLRRIAVSHGYEAIVTAHTASDRIETSLFNIFRGSGVQGLQSLTWKRSLSPGLFLSNKFAFRLTKPVESVEDPEDGTITMSKSNISLIRPLLNVTRMELRELREEMKLPLWPDPSNASVDIDRNRIRHQLLPYLRKHFNSGVDKSLARWTEILHGEQEYLDTVCENIRAGTVSEVRGPGGEEVGKKLDIAALRSLPVALQRRIVKQFSDGFTGKSLGFDTVERVRQAFGKASRGKRRLQVSIPGNCYLLVSGNELIVGRLPHRSIAN